MTSKANTLGGFIAELMARYDYSNRALANAAGVSESAIRNLLKVGIEPETKDPDARTLSRVAKALDVDALRLFRLAGYIPPEPAAHSIRGDFLAGLFDELTAEKQDAVLGLLEAMVDKPKSQEIIQQVRSNPQNPLSGMDLAMPGMMREIANQLVVQLQITQSVELDSIKPDTQIYQYRWKDLPESTKERIKALIRHKLSLDYDPTMVDPEWRE